jgi:hypothetical protein
MNRWTTMIVGMGIGIGTLTLAPQARAIYFGPVVNVDIQGSSDTQAGFPPMTATPTTFTTPAGNVTVALTGDGFYDRGVGSPANSGAFTYGALYHDFFYTNGSIVTADISGLTAGQQYDIRIYSYDYNNGTGLKTVTFTPISGTTGLAGVTTYTPGVTPLTNQESSALMTWTANGTGHLVFTISDDSAFSRINGFELTAVPEPSAAAALVLGAGMLLARRSRSCKE